MQRAGFRWACPCGPGYKWWQRFRKQGLAGLEDRSSRPHAIANQTCPERSELVLRLRQCRLTRARDRSQAANAAIDGVGCAQAPPRGTTARSAAARAGLRYEHVLPGDLLHLDVKKLGRIRGIGHRITGDRRSRARGVGWEYVHVAIDDYSRLGVRRGARERRSDHHGGFPEASSGLLSDSRHPNSACTHGQRQELHLASVPRPLSGPHHRALADQTVSTLHQRQGRTFHPDAAQGVGIQTALHVFATTHRRPAAMAPPIQPPSTSRQSWRRITYRPGGSEAVNNLSGKHS